ncbi:MAG: hypothetical protein IJQ39_06200 [Thermoguttaceae bacterium]|nr:hypothetical protein [Thermoguttaceae bacterium]
MWEKFYSPTAANLCEAEPEFDLQNVSRSFRSFGIRSNNDSIIPQYFDIVNLKLHNI